MTPIQSLLLIFLSEKTQWNLGKFELLLQLAIFSSVSGFLGIELNSIYKCTFSSFGTPSPSRITISPFSSIKNSYSIGSFIWYKVLIRILLFFH